MLTNRGKKSYEENGQDCSHNQMLFDPEERSPSASNTKEKRSSISIFNPNEAQNRLRSKGSFSLCMSNINQKLKLREEDQPEQQRVISHTSKISTHTGHSRQRKETVSQRHIKACSNVEAGAQSSSCTKYSHRAAELNQGMD